MTTSKNTPLTPKNTAMNKEALQHIFHSSEIEVIEHHMTDRFIPYFEVYFFNEGDNIDSVIEILKEDFENWFCGEFGIDEPRSVFFESYYNDTPTFKDDMLTYLLDTKRDCEANDIKYEDNWISIFNSISRIINPEIAA